MWLIFVFASISDSVSSPSLSFGVEQGVWLQDEVGSHWEIVGALAAFKCVGARETCCQATTAPLSFGCDDDALHISYTVFRTVCNPWHFFMHIFCILFSTGAWFYICKHSFVCKFTSVHVWVRLVERGCGKMLHLPLNRPSAPMADSPRLC